nr:hypothetical protein [uncultured Desulfobulbus sp.]
MTDLSEKALKPFHDWLNTPETVSYVLHYVAVKRQQASASPTVSATDTEDLCQDFTLFLLERFLAPDRMQTDLLALIQNGQFRRILDLAWGRFSWMQRDLERNKELNPRGYLYRRLREVLRQHEDRFSVTISAQGYPLYAPVQHKNDDLPFFAAMDQYPTSFNQWQPPRALGDRPAQDYVFNEQWLLGAADEFWHQVMRETGVPSRIAVRDLCRYLACHYPWLNRPVFEQEPEGRALDTPGGVRHAPEEQLLLNTGLRSIAPLAEQLVATWSSTQQQVFALRLADPPVTLKEVASRIGLSDHNKAHALYQKAVQSLRNFSSNWPGSPLSDLPEEVAQTFIEEVHRLCKKSLPCP